MRFYIALILLAIFGNINELFAQIIPRSPCPRFFQYRFDGTEWHGAISVRNTNFNEPLHLRVTLSMRGKPSTNYLGEIELLTRGQYRSNTSVLYKIKFPKTYFVPKLVEIQTNNQVICHGTAEHSYFVTQIQLEHTRKFSYIGGSGVNVGGDGGIGVGGGAAGNGGSGVGGGRGVASNIGSAGNDNLPALLSDIFKIPHEESANSRYEKSQPDAEGDSTVYQAKSGHDENHSTHVNSHNKPKRKSKEVCGTIHNPMQIDIKHNLRIMTGTNKENFHELESDGVSAPIITANNYDLPSDDDDASIVDDANNNVDELEEIEHGSWPWLAAIYVNNSTSLTYQCGGTLVSRSVVISSAHCFKMFKTSYTANEVLVFLGRHNLKNWNEEESVAASVDRIYIHPDFDHYLTSYDADIAVVVLKKKLRFNAFIRPACLWSGSPDLKYIHSKHGVVVGWGLSARNAVFAHSDTIPYKIDAPVVTNRACFKANEQFRRLSSNRTFCAGVVESVLKKVKPTVRIDLRGFDDDATASKGKRLKSGPCTGDSGAGLMILRNNRWTLRGTLSATLPVGDLPVAGCFLNQYVIYTDVAKFQDWILAFVI